MTNSSSTRPGLSAAIFDFNGTLFQDEKFHERAWAIMGERHGRYIPPGELERCVIGLSNREILSFLFEGKLSDEESLSMSREKEQLYRELCLSDRTRCMLSPGAEDFIDFLAKSGIPRTIATSSIPENVDFFFETFSLHRWFIRHQTVQDDGVIRCKPFPDMYLKAAKNLGVPMSSAMVLEDSKGGIQSAVTSGAGFVVAVAPKAAHAKFTGLAGINQIISDFKEIDRGLFSINSGQSVGH
jgi:beta-phosphoglucomutase-like phosphatase (HAD superfamily)